MRNMEFSPADAGQIVKPRWVMEKERKKQKRIDGKGNRIVETVPAPEVNEPTEEQIIKQLQAQIRAIKKEKGLTAPRGGVKLLTPDIRAQQVEAVKAQLEKQLAQLQQVI